MTKRLIVNADDYGHTPGVSAGIRQAHLYGIVTSTSVMMNRPDALTGIKTALTECPRLGMGVHLVLTTGIPVSNPGKIPSLVKQDESFNKLGGFVSHLDRLNPDEVWAEWNAQVEKFIQAAGRNPDHLDSHHHSSYFTPTLFGMMVRLANQIGVPIRKPWKAADALVYLPPQLAQSAMVGKLSLEGQDLPRTTDVFIGEFYDTGATQENLLNILKQVKDDPKNETFELMCHPAVVDDELRKISDYNTQRQIELAFLQRKEILDAILVSGIELTHFGAI